MKIFFNSKNCRGKGTEVCNGWRCGTGRSPANHGVKARSFATGRNVVHHSGTARWAHQPFGGLFWRPARNSHIHTSTEFDDCRVPLGLSTCPTSLLVAQPPAAPGYHAVARGAEVSIVGRTSWTLGAAHGRAPGSGSHTLAALDWGGITCQSEPGARAICIGCIACGGQMC